MELDDLKQDWNRATERIKPSERDVLALITSSDGGPLERLKKRFQRGLVLIPVVCGLALLQLSRKHADLMSHYLFWFFAIFMLVALAFFLVSYRLVTQMQQSGESLREHLERQVRLLDRMLYWRRIVTRLLALVYIVLLELAVHFGSAQDFPHWRLQPPGIRLLAYAGIFGVFYLITRFALRHRYGRHIARLKELVQELKEDE